MGCGSGGDIFAIDTAHFKVIGQLKVNPGPRSLAFLPNGSQVFSLRSFRNLRSEINMLDTQAQTLLKTIALPEGCIPMCIKSAADGKRMYASTGASAAQSA